MNYKRKRKRKNHRIKKEDTSEYVWAFKKNFKLNYRRQKEFNRSKYLLLR